MSPSTCTGAMLKPVAKHSSRQLAYVIAIRILTGILILNCLPAAGQTIIRSTLSSLGTAVSEEGLFLRQTIGQPSNTLIFMNGDVSILQGFQQPVSGVNPVQPKNLLDFRLYPNPAHGQTQVVFSEEIKDYTITIHNLTGTPLAIIPGRALTSKWLDLKDYPEGMYIITITTGRMTGSKKLILYH